MWCDETRKGLWEWILTQFLWLHEKQVAVLFHSMLLGLLLLQDLQACMRASYKGKKICNVPSDLFFACLRSSVYGHFLSFFIFQREPLLLVAAGRVHVIYTDKKEEKKKCPFCFEKREREHRRTDFFFCRKKDGRRGPIFLTWI